MNKLEGLPSIHYISLDESVERRANLEDWFKKYNIKNYTPHIVKRFEKVDFKIIGNNVDKLTSSFKGSLSSHFIVLKNWYENTSEYEVLICEDDLSLETIEYWNFTWKKFYSNLPIDWECIQLVLIREYDCSDYKFEQRKKFDWCAACYLINRNYVKYLLDTYYPNDVLDLSNFKGIPLLENVLFSNDRKIYSFPLFLEDCYNTKTTMISLYDGENIHNNQRDNHFKSHDSVLNWWKKMGKNLKISQNIQSTKDLTKDQIIKIYSDYDHRYGSWGWCSLDKAGYLIDCVDNICKEKDNPVCLEIGVYGGKSILPVALELKRHNKGLVYAIDPWSNEEAIVGYENEHLNFWKNVDLEKYYNIFINSIQEFNLSNRIKVIRSSSDDAPDIKNIDILYIDGQHTVQALKDTKKYASQINLGGYCLVDDVNWGEVRKVPDLLIDMGFQLIRYVDCAQVFKRTNIVEIS